MKKIVGVLVYLCLLGSVCFANPVAIDTWPPSVRPSPKQVVWYEDPIKLGIVIVLGIIVISVIVVIIRHKKKK